MSLKALIGIFAGILLVIAAVYYKLPKAGKAVLEGEVAAMNSAQSWRIRTEFRKGEAASVTRVHVAICPDKEHIVEQKFGGTSEYIRIGDDIYSRQGSAPWKKGMPSPYLFAHFLSPRPCLTNPNEPNAKAPGGSAEMKEWIDEDVREARITKGELKDDDGGSCREWTVTRQYARAVTQGYVVCLGEGDHLPRYVNAERGAFLTKYQWNPTLTIEAPDMSLPPGPPAGMP